MDKLSNSFKFAAASTVPAQRGFDFLVVGAGFAGSVLAERLARVDGARVLVDRIWPRGLTKEKADLDEWCKPVAPSPALRKWYAPDPERFEEFGRRYQAELEQPERDEAL